MLALHIFHQELILLEALDHSVQGEFDAFIAVSTTVVRWFGNFFGSKTLKLDTSKQFQIFSFSNVKKRLSYSTLKFSCVFNGKLDAYRALHFIHDVLYFKNPICFWLNGIVKRMQSIASTRLEMMPAVGTGGTYSTLTLNCGRTKSRR